MIALSVGQDKVIAMRQSALQCTDTTEQGEIPLSPSWLLRHGRSSGHHTCRSTTPVLCVALDISRH